MDTNLNNGLNSSTQDLSNVAIPQPLTDSIQSNQTGSAPTRQDEQTTSNRAETQANYQPNFQSEDSPTKPLSTQQESPQTQHEDLTKLSYEEFASLSIFDVLNMQNATEEEKQEVEDRMMDAVRDRALDRIDMQLSLEAQTEWKDIIDNDKEDDLEDFFKRNNINLPDIMIEEAVKYKMELVQLSEISRK